MASQLTLAEAEAELTTINSAISEIYRGTRRSEVRIGTNEFNRTYRFSDPQDLLKTLISERQRLTQYIAQLAGPAVVVETMFRTMSNIPMIVGRK